MHLGAAPEPLVRPGVNKNPGAPRGESRAHLPVEHFALFGLAVAGAVQTDFPHDQRAFAGGVVQPCQIGLEPLLGFEINVEANKIQKRQMKVFGRGIINVGDQAFRVFRPGGAIQPFQKAFHPAAAVPTHNRSGHFVANGVTEQGRMSGAGADFFAHHRFERTSAVAIIKETRRAFDRQTDHHPQAVALGGVQKPAWRHGVSANGVDAARRHQQEVALHRFRGGKLVPLGVGPKRAVGNASNVKLLLADENELTPYFRTEVPANDSRDRCSFTLEREGFRDVR